MSDDDSLDELPFLASALGAVAHDPEVERARTAIEARLLGGGPVQPIRIGRFVVLERLGAGGMGVVYAAFDPELDRKVAIKLLARARGTADEQARLVREARAMAKLAHPHVVHVYEVGEHAGQLFVAMELVAGPTLRAWWATPRTWRELLAACIAAGRGLAAAHAAGIVHRDFKPDNVIVGDDGRVRVLDFGLARPIHAPTHDDAANVVSLASPITTTLTTPRAGTPAYMAPEQLRGERADAASDQFAFCATLWEGLSGALPFPERRNGASYGGHVEAAPERPPADRMPRWIERVLRRGLSERDRFASLDRLLAALERDPAKVWAKRVGIAAAVAGMGIAFAMGGTLAPSTVPDACGGGRELLEQTWPTADREAAFAHVATLGAGFGAEVAPRASASVEGWMDRWATAHRAACEAQREGEQSSASGERRMACLDRGRAALRAMAGVMPTLAPEGVVPLQLLVAGLPDPDRCAAVHVNEIAGDAPPEADVIAQGITMLAVERSASAGVDRTAELADIVARARALGHGPVLAEALLMQGVVFIDANDGVAAARALREAVDVAIASGADELAVEAWGQLEWITARGEAVLRERPLDGRSIILQLAERRPFSASTMSLYNNLAATEPYASDPKEWRRMLERALTIARHIGPSAARTEATVLSALAFGEPDPERRAQLNAEAVGLWTVIAGPLHPRSLTARTTQAVGIADLDVAARELEQICTDYRRYHPRALAERADCEETTAAIHELRGDVEAANEATRRWVAVGYPESASFAAGMAELRYGDAAMATKLLEAELAKRTSTQKRTWWEEMFVAEAELALGRAWRRTGKAGADALIEGALQRLLADTTRVARPPNARRIALARALLDHSLPTIAGG